MFNGSYRLTINKNKNLEFKKKHYVFNTENIIVKYIIKYIIKNNTEKIKNGKKRKRSG